MKLLKAACIALCVLGLASTAQGQAYAVWKTVDFLRTLYTWIDRIIRISGASGCISHMIPDALGMCNVSPLPPPLPPPPTFPSPSFVNFFQIDLQLCYGFHSGEWKYRANARDHDNPQFYAEASQGSPTGPNYHFKSPRVALADALSKLTYQFNVKQGATGESYYEACGCTHQGLHDKYRLAFVACYNFVKPTPALSTRRGFPFYR
jgi:hypothetical protein